MSATSLLLLALITYSNVNAQTESEYYGNWLEILSDSSTGIDTSSATIFDIVLPGSSHAGMYSEAIIDNSYETSTDDYYNDVLTPYDNDVRLKWTQRQSGSVLAQLNAGARFLDLRLELKSSVVYAHNGLLGAPLSDILSDIKSFLDASNGKEIIILSFNDFVSISNAYSSVFSVVESTSNLGNYMKATGDYAITDTIDSLLADDINVIPFYDGSGGASGSSYVQDSSSLFTGSSSGNSTASDVTSSVLAQLINDRDTAKIHQIYYTLTIDKASSFTKYSNIYRDYQEYNADLAVTLPNQVNTYPKLFFGNIILVDFIQISTAVDQSILLNYNYNNCADTSDTCATDTNLARDYKDSGISQDCVNDNSLTTSCARSCGSCSWISDAPGGDCSSSSSCSGDIYSDAGVTSATCYEPTSDESSFIGSSSFCLSPFPQENCGTISTDTCSDDGSVDSDCTEYCADNYQCESGYCNTALGQCLVITTPAPTPAFKSSECYCPRVTSDLAAQFRDDIEPFRPGDPNGNYEIVFEDCNDPSSCASDNPYVESLVGFILVPFSFAIIMFIVYCCCCIFWCSCQTCSKKRCCKCCLGDPEESIGARWGPTVVMAAILVVILWATIEGIIANSAMHGHIFDEEGEGDGSLRTEIIGMFDTIIDKFEGVGPDAEWVINNTVDILNSVSDIIDTQNNSVNDEINRIYKSLNYISSNYDNFSIPTNVTAPFGKDTETVNVPCDYCSGLGAQIRDINDTLKDAVSVVDDMQALLNNSNDLVSARDEIDENVGSFLETVDNFTSLIEGYKNTTDEILDDFESYDKQRESAGTLFFIIPIFWIILWTIGIIMAAIPKCREMKCTGCLGEWCFRLTWCPAMFIGATIMLIFSFFAIVSVGWADFCVNLDEFEQDPLGSTLGQSITNFEDSEDGSSQVENVIEIVNACWTGSDLLDQFNLSDALDWESYRENLTDILNIDITESLSLDALDTLTSEINLLNTDEFEVTGDQYLADLNAVGDPCTCSPTCDSGEVFTREKLRNDECYNNTGDGSPYDCWFGTFANPQTAIGQECVEQFTLAYTYVNAELKLINKTQAAIDDIKNQSNIILQAYNELFGVAVGIENSIEDIACSIDPIFERFDALIANYSNCGFLGEIYGGFKDVGCVLLFGDMYWISVAMMVIAFFSILVVILGFMTQYSWYPVRDDDEDIDQHDFGRQISRHASAKFQQSDLGQKVIETSRRHLPGMSRNLSNDEANMANEVEMGTEGGGQAQPGTATGGQPEPPNEAPPGSVADGDSGGFTTGDPGNDLDLPPGGDDGPSAPTDDGM